MIKMKHSQLALAALTLLTCLVSARAWCAENNFDYTVSGAKGKVLKNIQARLKIIDQKHPRQLSAMRIHHLYTQGFREIKQAVMPFGYFNSLPRGQLSVQNNHWTAHYQVNLGPQLKITRSRIIVMGAGSKDLSLLALIKRLPVRKGQPFLSRAYNKSKNHLVRAAIERGYLNAKLTQHRVQINRVLRTCRIQWTLATGPRYRFGKTQFSGNLINTELLRRYITFRAGEYYAENKIRALQKNLQASGYFNSVIVKADITKASNHVVPIVITLQPARKRHYQAGLGYGTDTGFRGLASLTVNRLNNAGHTMNVSSRISQLQSEINANYIIPGDNPATEHYTINAAVNDTNYHQGRSLMGTTGLSYFRLWHSIHQIYTINYQIIESELKNKPRFTSHLLMPSVNWQWTHSTHPTNPSSGYYFDVLLRATNKSLGSNITFAQAVVHTKWLFPLTKNSNQELVLRLGLGHTATKEQDRIPLNYQFYVGGSQSIRGYGYHDIGPGPDFLTGSFELRQRITGNLYMAAFTDFGNTGDSIHLTLKRSAGVGLVYQSLVGNFAVSVSRPIGDQDHSYKVNMNIGPEF